MLISTQQTHGASFDINLFYMSDTFVGSSESQSTKMMIDFAPTLDLTRRGALVLGWNYGIVSLSESVDSSDSKFSATDMGPKIGWYINRDRTWSLFFTYNLISTAKYDDGDGELEWRGTSMKVELGYTIDFGSSLLMGAKLNYYSASYSEELSQSTNFEEISYSRSLIYPSLAMVYRF